MIVARLNGQLGNQLFVYATAFATAKEHGESLSIFKYEYDTVAKRFGYQLQYLNLDKYNNK